MPCVTVVAGLVIAVACAVPPPTPPMRAAKSPAEFPVAAAEPAVALALSEINDPPGAPPRAVLASNTTVGLL